MPTLTKPTPLGVGPWTNASLRRKLVKLRSEVQIVKRKESKANPGRVTNTPTVSHQLPAPDSASVWTSESHVVPSACAAWIYEYTLRALRHGPEQYPRLALDIVVSAEICPPSGGTFTLLGNIYMGTTQIYIVV